MLTEGPEVAELCADANFPPDPQQELLLDLAFAFEPDTGQPETFELCVICARQNLKTGFFKQLALGWMFVQEQPIVVWSAHEMSTTRAAQRELAQLMEEAPFLSKRMMATQNRGVYDANGEERIELADGRRIMFKARTQSGGRGLAVPKLILDEAFALKPTMLGSLLPLVTAQAEYGPQIAYGSSAAESATLLDLRDRGRAGSSDRMTYVEWGAPFEECADPDCEHGKDLLRIDGNRVPLREQPCALDREHLIVHANPSIVNTGRITVQTIRDLRQALPPEEYVKECLGWWPDAYGSAPTVFGPARWERCAAEDADVKPEEPHALGLAVSVTREWASIAASSVVELPGLEDEAEDAEPPEALYVAPVLRTEDLDLVVAEVARIQREYDCEVFADAKGPAASLREPLEDADVSVTWLTLEEYGAACDLVYDKVRARKLLHPGAPELDDAVKGATWRYVGDRRVWGRKTAPVDISMLEAATLAVNGADEAGGFGIY